MNTMSLPLAFYHPTKILLLDDNEAFLQTLEIGLGNSFDLQLTSNYLKALDIVESANYSNYLKHALFKSVNEDNNNFVVEDLFKIIYDSTRFSQISVVIVDYKMPAMNGVDFFERIRMRNVMKVLLTAEASKDIAIKAFNDGLIHHFLVKTSNDLNAVLGNTIKKLQRQFFESLSQFILEIRHNKFSDLRRSQEYACLFNDLIKKYHVVEYYLLDEFGSFLFFDSSGKPIWFIVRDEGEMQNYIDVAIEQEAPEEVINAFEARKKLLFQLTEKDIRLPVNYWSNYIFDAKKKNDFYYSVITERTKNNIQWDKICFYKHP